MGARGRADGRRELCINSIDADGTKAGYDLKITRMIADGVGIPVIASGGAGEPRHLLDAFTTGGADAAIVASIVHYGECTIPELKRYLRAGGSDSRSDPPGGEEAARENRDGSVGVQL